jgi:FkbM family methyltransferase
MADIVGGGGLAESTGPRFKNYLKQFSKLVYAKRVFWRFFRRLRSTVYGLPLFALKAVSHLPNVNSRLLRRIVFDIAAPNSVLVSNCNREAFVISVLDKAIGKTTYINREPYAFPQMEKISNILGAGCPKLLLIDIGANIGTVCIPAVKRGVFQNAIAIEPEPRNYSLLVANIYINGLADKILAYKLALGQKNNEQLLFELSRDNFGDHRVHIRNDSDLYDEAHRETITVRSETFDSVIKRIDPKESLIWMDTQGFEGHILIGAPNTLRLRPPICLEFWPYGMNRSQSYPLLKKALLEGGYNLFYDLSGVLSPTRLTAKSLDDLYEKVGDRGPGTDLLIV